MYWYVVMVHIAVTVKTNQPQPNDEREQDRLDLVSGVSGGPYWSCAVALTAALQSHHIYSMLLKGELHRAPIQNPKKVLDLGTGTGIWAIDFAEYVRRCAVSNKPDHR